MPQEPSRVPGGSLPPRGRPPTTAAPAYGGYDLLYYDGNCGLCHWWVSSILIRDPSGTRFRYAPLGGSTYAAQYPEAERAQLPDSVVVRTTDGRTLVRAAAAIHIGERLGGPWRILAQVASLLPRWLLDACYDGIARIRHRLFSRPTDVCPQIAPELRTRFLP